MRSTWDVGLFGARLRIEVRVRLPLRPFLLINNGMRLFELEETPKEIAERLGFDISQVFYHGTNKAFKRFNLRKLGKATGHPASKLGFFFTDSPESATEFAHSSAANARESPEKLAAKIGELKQLLSRAVIRGDKDEAQRLEIKWNTAERHASARGTELGQNIRPVYIRHGKQYMVDWEGTSPGMGPKGQDFNLVSVIAAAKASGYDTVLIKNIMDSWSDIVANQYVVFDPKNVRSIYTKDQL